MQSILNRTTTQDGHSQTNAVFSTTWTEHQITVLLVDDQPMIGEAVRRILAQEPDIIFHYCNSATKALQLVGDIQPTVILQDLVMPDMDGLVLLQLFRANVATYETPIIMLSTTDEATVKSEAFALGATDYLVKLPNQVELIARIRSHSRSYINLLQRNEAFQAMQQTQKLLEQAHQSLERRVDERTQELQQALRHLQQTQTQLIQAEKLSSLGQMVAGIAHEINNPINFIYGNLSHVSTYMRDLLELVHQYRQSYPEDLPEIRQLVEDIDLDFLEEDLPKMLSSMQVGADRIREIVLTLRNFSRLDEEGKKLVDLHEGIDSTLLILQNRLKSSGTRPAVQIVKDYGELPPVLCHAGQLNQVFMNLLNNAIDALEESRTEVLELSENRVELLQEGALNLNPTITIRTDVVENQRILISIKDNGPGIPEGVLARLFDPFFTTKPVGKGTGLGLSISHQIVVENHGGLLDCVSQLGAGAEFRIELPCFQESS